MSALLWGLIALEFSFTWVWHQDPPKYEKKYYFCHILGLNLNISYQIASLFHIYIDMGGRIAGKQDRSSLIIEDPLRPPQIAQNIQIYKNWFSNCFPLLYSHMSPLWWGLHLLTFWCPWILCKGPTWPRKKWNLFLFFSYFYKRVWLHYSKYVNFQGQKVDFCQFSYIWHNLTIYLQTIS